MYGFQYPCRCGRGKERFRDAVRINLSPFCVPKGLEVLFHQRLTLVPWDFDVVSSVDWVVDCRCLHVHCRECSCVQGPSGTEC